MLILVISDIHGNFQALQKVIEASRQFKWKQLWFLGDLFGYGPRPEECFNLLREENAVILPGNHDLYLFRSASGILFFQRIITVPYPNPGVIKKENSRDNESHSTETEKKRIHPCPWQSG